MALRFALGVSLSLVVLILAPGCSSDDPVDPGGQQTAPAAPTDLGAEASFYTTIDVTWTDQADDETGFDLEWSTLADFSIKGTAEPAPDAEAHTITELQPATRYHVRLRAVNGVGPSSWIVGEATTLSLPAGSFVIDDGAQYTRSTTVTLAGDLAGVAWMRFANEGYDWSEWEPFAASRTWILPDIDGLKTVTAQYRDGFDEVYERSDTIILDTTPPRFSPLFPFTINAYAPFTTSVDVTLNCAVSGAFEMQFCNDQGDWSTWTAYADPTPWTLVDEQGIRMVYARFRDEAGNVAEANAAIVLDSLPPTVGSFAIAGGAATTTTLAVTLNNSVTEAMEMRFSNNGSSWSAWQDYASTRSWTLAGVENATIPVYAQFRDMAGNVVQVSDTIVYDAVTRLTVSVDRIWVAMDGDLTGAGEWHWTASYADSDYPDAWQTISSGYQVVDQGESITIDDSVVIILPNQAGHSWTFRWHAWEEDNPPIDPDDNVGTITEEYAYPYETGDFEQDLGSDPRGVFYWSVWRLD
ncbi:MAG: fibronectin type III domain-containing protein [Candidatus Krumholzibacteriia bacterium]